MAAEIQASSLEGAMLQIMLAHAEADLMAARTEESSEAEMRTIGKLLYSALAAIEQAVGVPREELGGKAYLIRDLDPHAWWLGAGRKIRHRRRSRPSENDELSVTGVTWG